MAKVGVKGQRWLKAGHVLLASLWLGTILAALVLNLNLGKATDINQVQGLLRSSQIISNLIPPLSVGTIVTGLLICWLTAWGFFKHWSVVFQLAAAILVIVLAKMWLDPSAATLRTMVGAQGVEAVGKAGYSGAFNLMVGMNWANLAILAATCAVATIKPWGRAGKLKK